MDIARFIQIFIVQGGIGLIYLLIAYKILKREKKGINFILSCFYICGGLGVIINIIYAFIINETIVLTLHFITYFVYCLSLVFLLLTVLILEKSLDVITRKFSLLIICVFSILILGLLFIPNGIKINVTTNWKPEWSWPFFIYSVIVCSLSVIFPTIYYSIKLYNKFEHQKLRQKWKCFLIGIFSYYFLYYGTSLSNTLADPNFRLIWSLISLSSLFSLYFIYYSVAKQV